MINKKLEKLLEELDSKPKASITTEDLYPASKHQQSVEVEPVLVESFLGYKENSIVLEFESNIDINEDFLDNINEDDLYIISENLQMIYSILQNEKESINEEESVDVSPEDVEKNTEVKISDKKITIEIPTISSPKEVVSDEDGEKLQESLAIIAYILNEGWRDDFAGVFNKDKREENKQFYKFKRAIDAARANNKVRNIERASKNTEDRIRYVNSAGKDIKRIKSEKIKNPSLFNWGGQNQDAVGYAQSIEYDDGKGGKFKPANKKEAIKLYNKRLESAAKGRYELKKNTLERLGKDESDYETDMNLQKFREKKALLLAKAKAQAIVKNSKVIRNKETDKNPKKVEATKVTNPASSPANSTPAVTNPASSPANSTPAVTVSKPVINSKPAMFKRKKLVFSGGGKYRQSRDINSSFDFSDEKKFSLNEEIIKSILNEGYELDQSGIMSYLNASGVKLPEGIKKDIVSDISNHAITMSSLYTPEKHISRVDTDGVVVESFSEWSRKK